MRLAFSSLPKREVWKCFKSSPFTNLFSMLIYVARVPASSRACRYPLQRREQQPLPGTVTLTKSVGILTKATKEGGKGEGQTATQKHDLELKTTA